MTYLTSILTSTHKKTNFNCGIPSLNNYLQTQARQDMKRKLGVCFVLADEDNLIKGYYTLSSASIKKEILPQNISKKLPPTYLNLPATLLGRLAVDTLFKGQGIGELLLIDALKRSYFTSITSVGSIAVIVDPIDENAYKFYKKYGFILLPNSGKMFITTDTISTLF